MKTRTRLKLLKLWKRPGEFTRDYFLKRYPTADAPTEGKKPKPKAPAVAQARQYDMAAFHHLRDPFENRLAIDVVITWVDGADPQWQARKAKAIHGKRVDSIANDAARFQSKEELRFCLRSLNAFGTWINHIYIVTDRQTPSWLAPNPKITIVDHTEIIPEKYLPTFNSHVIETWLHRIPGLSEHFLYFNDDVMLGRPAPPSHYFGSNGLAYNFITRAETPAGAPALHDTPTLRGAKNVRALLQREFGVYLRYNSAHTVFPLRRSTYEAAHDMFADEIADYCHNKVRGHSDLPFASYLIPNLAFLRGEAVTQRTSCFYFDIRSALAERYYKTLLRRRATDLAPFSICLNDVAVEGEAEGSEARMRHFMESYFPIRAPWENDADVGEIPFSPQALAHSEREGDPIEKVERRAARKPAGRSGRKTKAGSA